MPIVRAAGRGDFSRTIEGCAAGTEGALMVSMGPRRLPANSRKLLVAAIGVAAVSYVGCGAVEDHPTSGNLMASDASFFDDTGNPPSSGNLMAPDGSFVDAADAAVDDAGDAGDAADADADADQ
jgi:hypothetical protein